jgi:hypothetical protein
MTSQTPRHENRKAARDEEFPFQTIDTRALLDLALRWLEDEALVERVLVTNPQGFVALIDP